LCVCGGKQESDERRNKVKNKVRPKSDSDNNKHSTPEHNVEAAATTFTNNASNLLLIIALAPCSFMMIE